MVMEDLFVIVSPWDKSLEFWFVGRFTLRSWSSCLIALSSCSKLLLRMVRLAISVCWFVSFSLAVVKRLSNSLVP